MLQLQVISLRYTNPSYSDLSAKLDKLEAKVEEHQRLDVEKSDQIIDIITKTVEIGTGSKNIR